jgi:hypothetical protein
MVFKSAQPFSQNLVFSLLSSLHIGVHSGVVFTSNIFEAESTVSVVINGLESLEHNISAVVVHGSDHNSN